MTKLVFFFIFSEFELNPVNGAVCPKLSSKTETLLSRLRFLWTHIKESRDQFEAESDSGFLGKGEFDDDNVIRVEDLAYGP